MFYFLSLMSDERDSCMLERHIPSYAARFTEDFWEYFYTQELKAAKNKIEVNQRQDVISWDTMVKGAEEELSFIRKNCPSAFLLIFTSDGTNPMKYIRAGVAPDALVMRPLDDKKIKKVLDESFELIYERLSKGKGKLISVYTGHAVKKIQVDMISYIESRDKKLYLRIKNQEYVVNGSIDDIAKELPQNFIRCHRSYIVNMLFVDSISIVDNGIILKNGDFVPISRTYKKELKDYGFDDE